MQYIMDAAYNFKLIRFAFCQHRLVCRIIWYDFHAIRYRLKTFYKAFSLVNNRINTIFLVSHIITNNSIPIIDGWFPKALASDIPSFITVDVRACETQNLLILEVSEIPAALRHSLAIISPSLSASVAISISSFLWFFKRPTTIFAASFNSGETW